MTSPELDIADIQALDRLALLYDLAAAGVLLAVAGLVVAEWLLGNATATMTAAIVIVGVLFTAGVLGRERSRRARPRPVSQ